MNKIPMIWTTADKTITHDGEREVRTDRFSLKLYFISLGWYLFGVCTGAIGMIAQYEAPALSKQVIQVEQGHERSSGNHPASKPITHDAAPPLAQADSNKIVMPQPWDAGTIDAKLTYRQTATLPNVDRAKAEIDARFARID